MPRRIIYLSDIRELDPVGKGVAIAGLTLLIEVRTVVRAFIKHRWTSDPWLSCLCTDYGWDGYCIASVRVFIPFISGIDPCLQPECFFQSLPAGTIEIGRQKISARGSVRIITCTDQRRAFQRFHGPTSLHICHMPKNNEGYDVLLPSLKDVSPANLGNYTHTWVRLSVSARFEGSPAGPLPH
ncbi:hypothetical protein CIHG_06496 [Coccidioides immitis H538.4]|uniref:Uncharacterized protein n=1 Tax=Coccidioides immitis H538.4 TaxID=396776 RepID=A0A0J8RXE4_COCIT|nr:hypothetical protein CIHG_06496 [Coccidioides immitis H538.4]